MLCSGTALREAGVVPFRLLMLLLLPLVDPDAGSLTEATTTSETQVEVMVQGQEQI